MPKTANIVIPDGMTAEEAEAVLQDLQIRKTKKLLTGRARRTAVKRLVNLYQGEYRRLLKEALLEDSK